MTTTLDDVNLASVPKPFKNDKYVRKNNRNRPLKQLLSTEAGVVRGVDVPTYQNIEAPPSLQPQGKYCDITGLPAKYTDPRTGLRYHDAEIYAIVKTMSVDAAQAYLQLRNSQIVLK